MARLPRPDIAGVAQHIIQRGNDRMPCFLDDQDRRSYLRSLREMSGRYARAIHAYVLMSNHVHLETTASVAWSNANSGAAPRSGRRIDRRDRHSHRIRHSDPVLRDKLRQINSALRARI
ncbi:MAG TPA: transposase [Rudaea sp.]|nr:transposase [Rudaea sp.]